MYNENMRKCRDCNIEKPLSEFRFYNRSTTCKFHSKQCFKCASEEKKRWVKANWEYVNESNKTYNKVHADEIRGNKIKLYWPGTDWMQANTNYKALRDNQNGVCAICKRAERRTHVTTGTVWDLAIDHCHTTGGVRGLLCNACNRGLGLLGDKIDTLEAVLAYLKKHKPAA